MPAYEFVTVDVFTEQRFGGNPLAVFWDAQGMSDGDMQLLAREFNLSETSFVLPPENPAHTARVRIFTPDYEMPFAGHPNVGTGYVLAQMERDKAGVLLFEELAGLVEVTVERRADGGIAATTIVAPQPLKLGATLPPNLIAACIGLDEADIVLTAHPPVLASVGTFFVLVAVTAEALSRATPEPAAFRQAIDLLPVLEGKLAIYLYTPGTGNIRTRMFAPLGGSWEDPATGSAATPLAALLLSHTEDASSRHDILQGVEMGRPSLLRTSAYRTPAGIRASVGGTCVPVLRGSAQL